MLILLTSPSSIFCKGEIDPKVVKVLTDTKAAHNPVGLISNHPEPTWFKETFGSSGVQFIQQIGRQSGEIISLNAKKYSLNPFNVLVLAASPTDVQMGKNGGAILVAAGWSDDVEVSQLGIRVNNAQEFQEVVSLTSGWPGEWWFTGDTPTYGVRALADLSTYYQPTPQQTFAKKLTTVVKNGGSNLNALLAITSRSILMERVGEEDPTLWGVYPSSNITNNDSEILSDFTHRLRTTVSRVRFAKRDEPLFIRHQQSTKRSTGHGSDRRDPLDQITSIHINPFYQFNNRLRGKHVYVIDDCTTYGISFGVATAFLRKAGATNVTGIALGKFGNTLQYHDIEILTDPFVPVASGGYKIKSFGSFPGIQSTSSQQTLKALIP